MENEHDLFNDDLPFDFNKRQRDDALREKSRRDLLNSIAATKTGNKSKKKLLWLLAFSVVVLLTGYLVFFDSKRLVPATIVKTGNFQRKLLLPDSSEILVNRFSEIQADLKNWSNSRREIWLTGEAFFEIRKVKNNEHHYNNFIVHTPKGDIEVLGTSFNVQTDSLGFSATLHTGSIKAHVGKEKTITLVPGEMLVVQGNSIQKKHVNVQLYSAWKDGEFHFDHTTLPEVVALIEKYYRLKVKIASNILLLNKKLSGNIAVKDSGQLFSVMHFSLNLTVRQKGDSLFISQ